MGDVKQVIVVRRDLNIGRGKLAQDVAAASMQFLVDNNEAQRGDEITVKLSASEAEWLMSGSIATIVGCDSQTALEDLIFQAEMSDVEVHRVTDPSLGALTCAAFGPCDAEEVDRITGNLKQI